MFSNHAPKAIYVCDLGTFIQVLNVNDLHCYTWEDLSYLRLLPGWVVLVDNTQGSDQFIKLSVLVFLDNTLAENLTKTEVTGVPLNKAHETEFSIQTSQDAGITHLKDDAIVEEVEAIEKPMSVFGKLLGISQPTPPQSIETFFERPIIITSGALAITDTVPVALYSAPMPSTGFLNTMWKQKCDGLYGMRFTMVFKLQINAARFQQGRYMLCWIPFGGCRGTTTLWTSTWDTMHRVSLQGRTQLPHVEIDIGTQTSAILKVPYSSVLTAYPMSCLTDPNLLGTLGRIYLYPYKPLVSASSLTSCGYSILMSLEDIETYGAAVPQMGKLSKKKKNPSEEEQDSQGVGPITSILGAVSGASGVLSTIPLLTEYMAPLSWVTGILGGTAAAFGWSKPTNMEHVMRYNRNAVAYANNVNAIDNSMPLSSTTDNAVSLLAGFSGCDADETAIMAIASRPAYLTTVNWSTSDVAGTKLAALEVAPMGNVNTSLQSGNTIMHCTPLQFACSQFRYWRGSIQYTFKIVKTEFHTGRIIVAFSPEFFKTTVGATTYANTTYLHKEIIDIRTCNSFTITVPYMAINNYKSIPNVPDTDFKTGGLFIYVVDPLVAPDTVSSTINLLVEHSAGPDFELAYPDPSYELLPMYNVTAQSGLLQKTGQVPPNSTEVVNIGNSKIDPESLIHAQSCIGERLLTFRQLLKKHKQIGPPVNVISPNTHPETWIYPFSWEAADATVANVDFADFGQPDTYSLMSSMFLYSRGGVMLKYQNRPERDTANTDSTRVVAYMQFSAVTNATGGFERIVTDSTLPSVTKYGCGELNMVHESNPGEESYCEISVPQYSPLHSRLNSEHVITPATYTNQQLGSLKTPWHVVIERKTRNATPDFGSSYVTRAGKDDCNFGYFVGIPPMLVRNRYEYNL